MRTVDTKEISRRFKLFKNIDPKVYEQLLRYVDQRVTELTVAVTEAPPDQILVCQGIAREARKFFQLMTELPEETTAPEQKQPNRPVP